MIPLPCSVGLKIEQKERSVLNTQPKIDVDMYIKKDLKKRGFPNICRISSISNQINSSENCFMFLLSFSVIIVRVYVTCYAPES